MSNISIEHFFEEVTTSLQSRKVCVSFSFPFRLPGRRSATSTKRPEQILETNLKGIGECPGQTAKSQPTSTEDDLGTEDSK